MDQTIEKQWPYKSPLSYLVMAIFITLFGGGLLTLAIYFAVTDSGPLKIKGLRIDSDVASVLRWAVVLVTFAWFAFGLGWIWDWVSRPTLQITLTPTGVVLPRDWRSREVESLEYKDIQSTAPGYVQGAESNAITFFQIACPKGTFRIWMVKLPSEDVFREVCQTIDEKVKSARGTL